MRKIIQEIPVNRIYLILVSTEDAYLDGVGTREQYGRLFQLINQQNGIDIRYKLPMVANYFADSRKIINFYDSSVFDLKFVTIKDGVLKKSLIQRISRLLRVCCINSDLQKSKQKKIY